MIFQFRYYFMNNGNNFAVIQHDIQSPDVFHAALELFRTDVLDFVFEHGAINASLIFDASGIICQYFGETNKFVNHPDLN